MDRDFGPYYERIKPSLTGEGKIGNIKVVEEAKKERPRAVKVEAKKGETIEAFSKRLCEIKVKMGSTDEIYGEIGGMYLRVGDGSEQSIIEDYKIQCMLSEDSNATRMLRRESKYSFDLSDIDYWRNDKSKDLILLVPKAVGSFKKFLKDVIDIKSKNLSDYKNIYVKRHHGEFVRLGENSTVDSILLDFKTYDEFEHEKRIVTDEYKERVAKEEAEKKELQQLRAGLRHLVEECKNVDPENHIKVKSLLNQFSTFGSNKRLKLSVEFAVKDIMKELKAKGYRENLNLPRKVTYERYIPLEQIELSYGSTVNSQGRNIHYVSSITPKLAELLDELEGKDRKELAEKYLDGLGRDDFENTWLREIGRELRKSEDVAFIRFYHERRGMSCEKLALEVCAVQEIALEYLDRNTYQVCEVAEEILPGGKREIVVPILFNRQAQDPPNLTTQAVMDLSPGSPEAAKLLKELEGKDRKVYAKEYWAEYKSEESRQKTKEDWIWEIYKDLRDIEGEAYITATGMVLPGYDGLAIEVCAIREVALEYLDLDVYEVGEPEYLYSVWKPLIGIRIKKK